MYTLYLLFSLGWFLKFICTRCPLNGRGGCPSGYSRVSAHFFRRPAGPDFRGAFRRHVPVVFPVWFVPAGLGLYLLFTRFSAIILLLYIGFCVIAFVVVPVFSRKSTCPHCEAKGICPWMRA